MKIKYLLLVFWFIVLVAIKVNAQNTNTKVTNVAFSISGTTVTVTYDVTDAEQDVFTILMYVSSDGGSTWDYNYGTGSGAIGTGVTEGTNKTIQWEYTGDYNPNFKIRIYANDETAHGDNCGKVYYEGGPNSDGGGAYYNTIQIGTQCWMKENLNVGTRIDVGVIPANNSVIEKWCYGDNETNCSSHGALYHWDEAMQYVRTQGAQGICPTGWHIPTLTEFKILEKSVGSSVNSLYPIGIYSGTNTSGFSALLAGGRHANGYYVYWGLVAIFNASTELDYTMRWEMRLGTSINYYAHFKWGGISVRCLKN
jgi:uncharacterized protein (TIGR02145 family)